MTTNDMTREQLAQRVADLEKQVAEAGSSGAAVYTVREGKNGKKYLSLEIPGTRTPITGGLRKFQGIVAEVKSGRIENALKAHPEVA